MKRIEPRHILSAPTKTTTVPSRKSQALPLPRSHIPRTESELQLCEDEAMAEWRDYCMFHLLIRGIQEKQLKAYETMNADAGASDLTSIGWKNNVHDIIVRNKQSMDHIINTRNKDIQMSSNKSFKNGGFLKTLNSQSDEDKQQDQGDWSFEGYELPDLQEQAVSSQKRKRAVSISSPRSSILSDLRSHGIDRERIDMSEEEIFTLDL